MADGNAFKENVIGNQLGYGKYIVRTVILVVALSLLILSFSNYDSSVDINGNLVSGDNNNDDVKLHVSIYTGIALGIMLALSIGLAILVFRRDPITSEKAFNDKTQSIIAISFLFMAGALIAGSLMLNWVINYVGFGNRSNNDKTYKYGFLAGVILIVYGLVELVYIIMIYLQKKEKFLYTSKYLDYTLGGVIFIILFGNFFTSLLGYIKYDNQAYSRFGTSGGTPTKIGRQTWYKLSSDNNIDGKDDALIGMALSIFSLVGFGVLFFYYIYLNYINSKDADIKLSSTGTILIVLVSIVNFVAGVFLFRASTDYEDLDERTDQQVSSHMLCNISGALMISSSVFIILLLIMIRYIRDKRGIELFGKTKEAKEAYNNYIEKLNKERSSSGTSSSSGISSNSSSDKEPTPTEINEYSRNLVLEIEKYMRGETSDSSDIINKYDKYRKFPITQKLISGEVKKKYAELKQKYPNKEIRELERI